jgi:hypothetical protein
MKACFALVVVAVALRCSAYDAPDPIRDFGGGPVAARGKEWVVLWGRVLGTHPDGVRLDGYYFNRDVVPPLVDGGVWFEGEFFVKNFPYVVADGDVVDGYLARLDEIHSYATVLGSSRNIHSLDYGNVWRPRPVAPAQPPTPTQLAAAKEAAVKQKAEAAAKVLKLDQDLADAGDPFGQYRMGQRYLTGDGVEKDLSKARALLYKSTVQGNTNAAALLAHFPASAPPLPAAPK